jgi:hypothetical protein
MVGTVRQGDWEASTTTLKQLTTARGARNFPIINHSRARGLMHKLRFRMMAIVVGGWVIRGYRTSEGVEWRLHRGSACTGTV